MTALSVVIVNYNTREHLRACLDSLRRVGSPEVLVVDNASSDGSPEMVRSSYPWVTLLANETNPGYGNGANLGIASCSSDYVLLLNSDTLLEAGTIDALRTYLDRYPSVAVVGPRLNNADGTLQPSCYAFPTPLHIFLQESSLGRVIRFVPVLRERSFQTWSHAAVREVPWLLGAALAMRRAAFEEVGGFDTSFFMYYEEVDLCFRLHQAGWQVHFAPVTRITHVGGASTSQVRAEMLVQWFASIRHFYQRHYSRVRLVTLILVVKAVVIGRLIRDIVHLFITKDPTERIRLTESFTGWRRILLGQTS